MCEELYFRSVRPVSTTSDVVRNLVFYPIFYKFVVIECQAYAVLLTDDRNSVARFVDETGVDVIECLEEPQNRNIR